MQTGDTHTMGITDKGEDRAVEVIIAKNVPNLMTDTKNSEFREPCTVHTEHTPWCLSSKCTKGKILKEQN